MEIKALLEVPDIAGRNERKACIGIGGGGSREKGRNIYLCGGDSGEAFGVVSEEGKVKDFEQIEDGIIQPVDNGDATR